MSQSLSQMRAAAQASGNAFLSATSNPSATSNVAAKSDHQNANSEGAALAVLSLPPNLPRVEGHRVLAVVQKAVERLRLLTLLDAEQLGKSAVAAANATAAASEAGATSGTNAAGDQQQHDTVMSSTTGAAGQNSGIAQILQEQARLEHRYDSLVAASKARQGKNPNEPVLDPQCFAHVPDQSEQKRQQELQEVAASLKSHSKMLCRLLKDNPCDADNWRKIVMERADLIAALESCALELGASCQPPGTGGSSMNANTSNSSNSMGFPGTFQKFATKVLEDQAASVWADGLVRKERETNQNVKQLQNEVKAERALKEQEIEQRQKMISELKSQLTSLRNAVRAQLDQLRSQTEAASEAQQRDALNHQRVLKEKLAVLRVRIQDEQAISGSFKAHTAAACVRADRIAEEWNEKYNEATKAMQNEKADREKAFQRENDRLQATRERCDTEALNAKARAEMKKEMDEEKERKEALALARYAAATKVQAAIKAFFTRQVLVGLKKKALKKNRRAAAAAASAAKAPAAKPGRK